MSNSSAIHAVVNTPGDVPPGLKGRLASLPQPIKRPQGLKSRQFTTLRGIQPHVTTATVGYDFRHSRITAREIEEAFNRCYGCGSVLELRQPVDRTTGEAGRISLFAANFCTQPVICEVCAGRVGDRRQARFAEAIKSAVSGGLRAYMVTFTLPTGESLPERLTTLKEALRRFQLLGQKGRRGEWSKVRAGLAKIEIKRGSGSGLWHCHAHAILFTDSDLNFALNRVAEFRGRMVRASKISSEWLFATRGEAMGVRVDVVRMKPEHEKRGLSLGESVLLQSREVLKYITKFNPQEYGGDFVKMAADFVEVKRATYCKRLFSTFGEFRRVPGSDFVSDGPYFADGPAIYSSRWGMDSVYSDLRWETRPIFPGTERSLSNQFKITMLNRYGGTIRRIRSAVLKSRDEWLSSGNINPAFYDVKTYSQNGQEILTPSIMEPPKGVLSDPANMETWEKWIDDVTDLGREGRATMRRVMDLEILDAGRSKVTGWHEGSGAGKALDLVISAFLATISQFTGPPETRGHPLEIWYDKQHRPSPQK